MFSFVMVSSKDPVDCFEQGKFFATALLFEVVRVGDECHGPGKVHLLDPDCPLSGVDGVGERRPWTSKIQHFLAATESTLNYVKILRQQCYPASLMQTHAAL